MHWHIKTAGQSVCIVLACALCLAPYLYLYVQRSETAMSYPFWDGDEAGAYGWNAKLGIQPGCVDGLLAVLVEELGGLIL